MLLMTLLMHGLSSASAAYIVFNSIESISRSEGSGEERSSKAYVC